MARETETKAVAGAVVAVKRGISSRLINAACTASKIRIESIDEKFDFFSALKTLKPEILFIDESFAGENKIALIDRIRNSDDFGSAYIVFVSSNTDDSGISRNIGTDTFLPIPFSKSKFDSILRPFLNQPRRVLIAGSPESDISGLMDKLDSIQLEVSLTRTTEETMTLAHKIFPDLIIVTYDFAEMSGTGLCARIRNTNLISHIPVLIISENSDAETIESCFEAGAQDVLLDSPESEENIAKITAIVAPPKKGRKEKVLVIDDSPMIRNIISKMFKQLGFSVTAAENGVEGIKSALEVIPDVITCDYDMPVMNGWEFCIEAKRRDEIKDIPIIMVTARGTEVDKKKGKVLGVAEYLTKPFKEPDLLKSVNTALANVRKKKEREALAKYVASDVLQNVSDVIDGVKGREPEEKFITLLFNDIVSFTPKCERLDPDNLVRLLNSYFSLMIEQLQANNAIIDKLIGDAILARFDSGDEEKDALDAAKSAHSMLEALKDFNQKSEEPFECRIGINSGNVILGNIGSESYRLDYTMIGDNVNIAARLESEAPKMGCLMSEFTYKLISAQVSVGPGIEMALKGKSDFIKAYPLLEVL